MTNYGSRILIKLQRGESFGEKEHYGYSGRPNEILLSVKNDRIHSLEKLINRNGLLSIRDNAIININGIPHLIADNVQIRYNGKGNVPFVYVTYGDHVLPNEYIDIWRSYCKYDEYGFPIIDKPPQIVNYGVNHGVTDRICSDHILDPQKNIIVDIPTILNNLYCTQVHQILELQQQIQQLKIPTAPMLKLPYPVKPKSQLKLKIRQLNEPLRHVRQLPLLKPQIYEPIYLRKQLIAQKKHLKPLIYKVTCPICRTSNTIYTSQKLVKGINEMCCVCMGKNVEVYLPQCGHICLCYNCCVKCHINK